MRTMGYQRVVAAAVGGILVLAVASGTAFAASKCSGDKIKAAGKKAASKLTCHSKAVTKGLLSVDSTCIAKAEVKFSSTFAKAEAKTYSDDGCLTTGDATPVEVKVDQFVDSVAPCLAGGSCATLGLFPATGQMTCWDSAGFEISCAGTGHDGEVQAGATLAYVDNGNGTITDANTGLMWEKLSDDGSIHDQDTNYTWDNAFAVHVAGLNTATFAGHNDWRMPNYKELVSILNLENVGPALSSAFNTGCAPACTVLTCSCPGAGKWSSTTYVNNPQDAYLVFFPDGQIVQAAKSGFQGVRGVRGGS